MKQQVMVFKIDEETNKELRDLAKENERTKAYYIRKAIKKLLEDGHEE